jgi:hypothetical protein
MPTISISCKRISNTLTTINDATLLVPDTFSRLLRRYIYDISPVRIGRIFAQKVCKAIIGRKRFKGRSRLRIDRKRRVFISTKKRYIRKPIMRA